MRPQKTPFSDTVSETVEERRCVVSYEDSNSLRPVKGHPFTAEKRNTFF